MGRLAQSPTAQVVCSGPTASHLVLICFWKWDPCLRSVWCEVALKHEPLFLLGCQNHRFFQNGFLMFGRSGAACMYPSSCGRTNSTWSRLEALSLGLRDSTRGTCPSWELHDGNLDSLYAKQLRSSCSRSRAPSLTCGCAQPALVVVRTWK